MKLMTASQFIIECKISQKPSRRYIDNNWIMIAVNNLNPRIEGNERINVRTSPPPRNDLSIPRKWIRSPN